GAGGGGGAVGGFVSLFQMSSTISHFPFCWAQRTMYFPESAAGMPAGSWAPAGNVQVQRPVSTAIAPVPITATARGVRFGFGFIVLMTAKNARIESLPRMVAMFGGITTASTA